MGEWPEYCYRPSQVLTDDPVAIRISAILLVGLGAVVAVPGLVSAPESLVLTLWGAGLFALNFLLKAGLALPTAVPAPAVRLQSHSPLTTSLGQPVEN